MFQLLKGLALSLWTETKHLDEDLRVTLTEV